MKKCKESLSDFRHGERASSAALPAALLLGSGLLLASLLGCPSRDPGFEIVRVPESAYLPFDGGHDAARGDAGDAGAPDAALQAVVCVPVPTEDDGDFEASDDFPDCPASRDGDAIDPRTTQAHRDKGEELCCYRRGRRTRLKSEPIHME